MNTTAQRNLRILLSAYACEPGKGSEPGVGWNWALALARRGHEVWVLTRLNNLKNIEPEMQRLDPAIRDRLHFIYYDLPKWSSWWKQGGRGVHLYYLLWQWGAYQLARQKHTEHRFDRVHHVTFVSARQPSFMGGLGIPFVFGPVAGGERAPWNLRIGYGLAGWLLDAVRDAANVVVKFDPLMRRTFTQAERIYVTSEQTLGMVPRRYWSKTQIKLAIALDRDEAEELNQRGEVRPFRILYVGHFLYLKGMHLGLAAFSGLLQRFPDARLSMIGRGPDEARWRRRARQLGIASNIDWMPWVKQSELTGIYRSHDVLLFPSLHDSGGMVVLEAMQHGLPVACLKLGGPGVMVDETCGLAVDVAGLDESAVVERMAEGLLMFAGSADLMERLREGARERARAFTWDALVAGIYGPVEESLATEKGR